MQAGIPDNQLLIALEPEAASIYCQYLPIEKLTGAEKGFSMTDDGTKYMVVDNGGTYIFRLSDLRIAITNCMKIHR